MAKGEHTSSSESSMASISSPTLLKDWDIVGCNLILDLLVSRLKGGNLGVFFFLPIETVQMKKRKIVKY